MSAGRSQSPGQLSELHSHSAATVREFVTAVIGDPQPAAGLGEVLPSEQKAAEPGGGGGVVRNAFERLAEPGLICVVSAAAPDERAEVKDEVPVRFRLLSGK